MAGKYRLWVRSIVVTKQQESGSDHVDVRLSVDNASKTTKSCAVFASKADSPVFYDGGFNVVFDKKVRIRVWELDTFWDDPIATDWVFAPKFGEKWISFSRKFEGDGACYFLHMVLEEIPVCKGSWDIFMASGGFTRPNNLGMFIKDVMQVDNGLAILICIILFAIIHQMWIDQLRQETQPQSGGAKLPARAVWIWNRLPNESVKTTKFLASNVLASQKAYFDWAKLHNINQAWISVDDMLVLDNHDPDNPVTQSKLAEQNRLRVFCKSAADQGMVVNLLCLNSPRFALKEQHPAAKKQLNAVLALIGGIDPAARPAGVQIDVEPVGLTVAFLKDAGLPTDKSYEKASATILAEYVELLKALRGMCAQASTTMCHYVNLCAAVSWWWLAPKAKNNKVGNEPVGYPILASRVDVAVMNYRLTQAAAIADATPWISAATAAGQLAWIGFECNPVGDPNYSEKANALEPDLVALSDKFADDGGFATVAIDDANGYFNLIG